MKQTRTTLFQQLKEENLKVHVEQSTWRTSRSLRFAILIVSPILAAFFFPTIASTLFKNNGGFSAVKGQSWQNETIVAQNSFALRKSEEQYKKEVELAQAQSPYVFRPRKREDHSADLIRELVLKSYPDLSPSLAFRQQLRILLRTVESKEFINRSKSRLDQHPIAVMPQATVIESRNLNSVVDSSDVQVLIEQGLHDVLLQTQITAVAEIILRMYPPNLEYWSEKSDALKSAAADNVAHSSGIVRKGEIVVRHAEILDDAAIARLSSYGAIRVETSSSGLNWSTVAGSVLHSVLVYALFVLFVYFLRKKIINDNLRLLSLSSFVVLSAVMSWLSLRVPAFYAAEFLVLIPAVSMIAAIYFDSRTGFMMTVTCALMFAAVRSNDLSGAFALLLAGTLGAYSVRDLRNRTQLFRSIAFIAGGFLLVILAFTLERGGDLSAQWRSVGSALINAVVSPLLTFAVIAVSERYFGVLTDLALHEYDNVNHPLLLEMSEKAPGTYQHTLAIANLVESAAYAIEASPLLARVGAYFHDIGKIPKAEYFIENQIELENKHDLLSPKKSASIIRNHVQDGLELAKEYGLPRRVADFIPMHHGTTLIKHFYAKAVEEFEADGSMADLQEELFRYPGPKPNSKETALVMLADGVEAISRVIDDREELEAKIDVIFKDKILDGQLDECDLTMKDIATIRDIFARNLVGAHHQRIQYKELRNESED